MKNLPNLITLLNLICGCIAITFVLSAPSFVNTTDGQNYSPVIGMEQLYWGSVFIALAALMDMLDGLVARALNAYSPIGKDLDSLADVVSFGVAPSMILFKMLWLAYMSEPGALETPLIVMVPAFLPAAAAALRLAKFNRTAPEQKNYFIGMPTPAAGLVTAALPLVIFVFQNRATDTAEVVVKLLRNRWLLYAVIVLLCWLMNSNIRFFKWRSPGGIVNSWRQIVVAAVAVISAFFWSYAAIPLAFCVYVLLSLFYKPGTTTINS